MDMRAHSARRKIMGTIIVGAIVVAIVILVICTMVRDKKKGKSCHCGGNCSTCGINCHQK